MLNLRNMSSRYTIRVPVSRWHSTSQTSYSPWSPYSPLTFNHTRCVSRSAAGHDEILWAEIISPCKCWYLLQIMDSSFNNVCSIAMYTLTTLSLHVLTVVALPILILWGLYLVISRCSIYIVQDVIAVYCWITLTRFSQRSDCSLDWAPWKSSMLCIYWYLYVSAVMSFHSAARCH